MSDATAVAESAAIDSPFIKELIKVSGAPRTCTDPGTARAILI